MDFVIIHFEYDTTPDAAVLAWANGVLQANPNRRAIVVSHYILNAGRRRAGQPLDVRCPGAGDLRQPQGQPEPLPDAVGTRDAAGRTAPGHLQRQHRALAALRLPRPRRTAATAGCGSCGSRRATIAIYVQTYSPTLDQFETDDSSQFTVDYAMGGASFAVVATRTNVPSGGHATALVAEPRPGDRVRMVRVVDDGTEHASPGRGWTFTTLADGATDADRDADRDRDAHATLTPTPSAHRRARAPPRTPTPTATLARARRATATARRRPRATRDPNADARHARPPARPYAHPHADHDADREHRRRHPAPAPSTSRPRPTPTSRPAPRRAGTTASPSTSRPTSPRSGSPTSRST